MSKPFLVIFSVIASFLYVSTASAVQSIEFSELKNSMKHSCSSPALERAKKYIDGNEVTSAQVKEMLSCLDFEAPKLELAKYAYHKLVDIENYIDAIEDEFFMSSVRELKDYIKGYSESSNKFSELIKSMKQSCSSPALERAKKYIDANQVTSNHVKEMLGALSFFKLELAKYAYHKLADKKKYIDTIEDELRMRDVCELKNYINQ